MTLGTFSHESKSHKRLKTMTLTSKKRENKSFSLFFNKTEWLTTRHVQISRQQRGMQMSFPSLSSLDVPSNPPSCVSCRRYFNQACCGLQADRKRQHICGLLGDEVVTLSSCRSPRDLGETTLSGCLVYKGRWNVEAELLRRKNAFLPTD